MRTVDVGLDDAVFDRIDSMAREEGLDVVQYIKKLIEGKTEGSGANDAFLGMLADQPELADAISEQAMISRERHTLRA